MVHTSAIKHKIYKMVLSNNQTFILKYKLLLILGILILISPLIINITKSSNPDKDGLKSNLNLVEIYEINKIEKSMLNGVCSESNPFSLAENLSFLSNDIISNFSSCAAGGPGATMCSLVGLCSVGCSSGYYACCSILYGCHCIAVDAPGEEG